METRQDIYARVTNTVIAQLEQGTRQWAKPWQGDHPAGSITRPLRWNGERYSGVNVLMLWASAEVNGYAAPLWVTYKQAEELGAHVKKGEHGSLVVYADRFKKKSERNGETVEESIPFLKSYVVFNAEQIEGLPERFYAAPVNKLAESERIERAERFIQATGARIEHGGMRACYWPDFDKISMPDFGMFRDAQGYYATALHELTHWTKAPARLDRKFEGERFRDKGYAREELVAELGAAFLCADLGITCQVRDDHASYIDAWLSVLKEDKRAIFNAASHAQRAADYLVGLQGQEVQ